MSLLRNATGPPILSTRGKKRRPVCRVIRRRLSLSLDIWLAHSLRGSLFFRIIHLLLVVRFSITVGSIVARVLIFSARYFWLRACRSLLTGSLPGVLPMLRFVDIRGHLIRPYPWFQQLVLKDVVKPLFDDVELCLNHRLDLVQISGCICIDDDSGCCL